MLMHYQSVNLDVFEAVTPCISLCLCHFKPRTDVTAHVVIVTACARNTVFV